MPPSRLISERDTFSFVEYRLLSMAFLGDNHRLHNPTRPQRTLSAMCLAGIVGAVFLTTILNRLFFRKG